MASNGDEDWTTTAMAPVAPGLWALDGAGPIVVVLVQQHKNTRSERVKLGYADRQGTVFPAAAVTSYGAWERPEAVPEQAGPDPGLTS